jgi:hypothetical protein
MSAATSGRSYKIRKGANGPSRRARTKHVAYEITVPTEIAERLLDHTFSCRLTDDGILFRPLPLAKPNPVPAWVAARGGGS